MPSSTSNFEVPYREIPAQPWPRLILIAVVFTMVALSGWELLARRMHHRPGNPDGPHTTMWAVERRKLDVPNHGIRVVVIGASRILWATDLDILERHLGSRPLQLAKPGSSPSWVLEDIVNNTNFSGLLLVGHTPGSFSNIVKGKREEEALKLIHDESPSQKSGTWLYNLLSDHLAFMDDGFPLFKLIDHYSNFPHRKGATEPNTSGWKLGNTGKDRQTDMWEPVETVGSFDNVQMTNCWDRNGQLGKAAADPKTAQADALKKLPKVIEYYAPLIEKFRARGGDLVIIRMPAKGLYLERDILTDYRNTIWQPLKEKLDAPAIDCMDFPELSSDLEIPEWSHLSRKSQDDWSERIYPHIERAYQEKRGTSLREYLRSLERK